MQHICDELNGLLILRICERGGAALKKVSFPQCTHLHNPPTPQHPLKANLFTVVEKELNTIELTLRSAALTLRLQLVVRRPAPALAVAVLVSSAPPPLPNPLDPLVDFIVGSGKVI
jgi:hypothetical protein